MWAYFTDLFRWIVNKIRPSPIEIITDIKAYENMLGDDEESYFDDSSG